MVDATPLGNWPSDYALSLLDMMHTGLDLPWWAAIACTALVIRTSLLPMSVVTMTHAARMQKAKLEMQVLQKRIQQDSSRDPVRTATYQRQMAALLQKLKVKLCCTFLLPLCQLPIFISMFFGLQRLGAHFPDTATGGALWFEDLTVADPTYALPFATGALFFLVIEIGATTQQRAKATIFHNILRFVAVSMIPLTAHMPASVFVYFLTANGYSLAQVSLLNNNDAVRKRLGIPPRLKVTSTARVNALAKARNTDSRVTPRSQQRLPDASGKTLASWFDVV